LDFSLLSGYSIAHVIYKPFAQKVDNTLEFTSQLVLLITLFVGLLIGVDVIQTYELAFSFFLLGLNALFMLFGGLVIVHYYAGSMWKKCCMKEGYQEVGL
jgi:hypothetical protein